MGEIGVYALVLGLIWTFAVFRFGVWVGRGGAEGRDLRGPPRTASAPAKPGHPATLPADAEAAIEDALRRDNKIEAIKILRGASGLGLREAKEAIEARYGR